MKNMLGRIAPGTAAVLCLVICISTALLGRAAPASAQRASAVTRRQLIGTWQLVSIQDIGPDGRTADPFYGAEPAGMLIYDPAGWMSVQIAGHTRPAMDAHGSRNGNPHTAENAQLEAAVLDTYYAYAATWTYDARTSRVTHHVEMSLIPGETSKDYSQTVRFDGASLVFRVAREDLGKAVFQEKVWKRMPGRPVR
jgi:hypothetical protein